MFQAKSPITAQRGPLSYHLAQFTSQIFPPRPSPSIPGHLHFVPSLTDDYSFSRPPGGADMRAHQPRSVYVYPVKRGKRRHSRPHTPLIRTCFPGRHEPLLAGWDGTSFSTSRSTSYFSPQPWGHTIQCGSLSAPVPRASPQASPPQFRAGAS